MKHGSHWVCEQWLTSVPWPMPSETQALLQSFPLSVVTQWLSDLIPINRLQQQSWGDPAASGFPNGLWLLFRVLFDSSLLTGQPPC